MESIEIINAQAVSSAGQAAPAPHDAGGGEKFHAAAGSTLGIEGDMVDFLVYGFMMSIHRLSRLLPLIVAFGLFHMAATGLRAEQPTPDAGPEHLAVLWTSGDPDVAHRMAFLYTLVAKKQAWFNEVTLIIWGPSQRLLAADKEIQAYVKKIQDAGVLVEACINCSEAYGITETIRGLGIEVKPMGKPLTQYLKDPDWATLSF